MAGPLFADLGSYQNYPSVHTRNVAIFLVPALQHVKIIKL